MEIRAKDILFITVAGPGALVAAYLWLWRPPLVASTVELAGRSTSLVAVEDYEMNKRHAHARLNEAREALEAARNVPQAQTKVAAPKDLAQAARERAALNILRSARLDVIRSASGHERSTSAAAHLDGEHAPDAQRALHEALPELDPIRRRWTLDGSYPALKRALNAFATSLEPVIPERLEMTGQGSWILEASL